MTESSDYLPALVYSGAQVAELDRRFVEEFEIDGFSLMQRAARAAFDELAYNWPMPGRMVVLCGAGHNGGDGFLVARHALAVGWQVSLQMVAPRERVAGNVAKALAAFEEAGGTVDTFVDQAITGDVIVDAMLGTGLDRDVDGDVAAAIDRINTARARGTGVFAVDIPSGIDATTGQVRGLAVNAHATATFIGLKMGLLTGAGPAHCGQLSFDGLDAPEQLYEGQAYLARRIDHRALRHVLPTRERAAHKGDFGHVLCMGGNRGMGGAIRLCAEAALRTGAGRVSVACHADHAGAMSQARPELMCLAMDDEQLSTSRATSLIDAASVIAIGPGLGTNNADDDNWGAGLWQAAMDAQVPLVVDADALNRLAVSDARREKWVLTPHPGEAARLLDCSVADIENDRVKAVQSIARRYNAVVILKGAGTLIATAQDLWLCTQGNPGMAAGGMGDLLTGVIASLLAQGLSCGEAAVFGVYIHALAGDSAAAQYGERGLLPSDLFDALRQHANPVRRGL